jgi:uncharacterized coiled-coil DUF342 family protein
MLCKGRLGLILLPLPALQALETLRKLRLEKTQEVKEMRLKLDTLKSHKDMAASFSADIAAGKAKAERLNQEIQELQVGDCYCYC